MDSLVVRLHDVTCDHLFAARIVGILVDFRESCYWVAILVIQKDAQSLKDVYLITSTSTPQYTCQVDGVIPKIDSLECLGRENHK